MSRVTRRGSVIASSICAVAVVLAAGCYTGAPATRDVNAAWVGRTRIEIDDRWGPSATAGKLCFGGSGAGCDHSGSVEQWSFSRRHIELPDVVAKLGIQPGQVDFAAAVTAGAI